ncbi:MAG: 2,3,4,5-tetrahydropyridine-2,6-dicarboxylate N-succinyltransferase, partial [Candidatus Nanopelagicaceae bacterium]
MSKASVAYGYGISTIAKDGSILDTYFHQLGLGAAEASRVDLANLEGADNEREITRALVKTEIELDKPPASVSDAYLRLHLLSHRLVKPHGLSLEGIFSILNNVIWTSHGPCAIAGFDQVRLKL